MAKITQTQKNPQNHWLLGGNPDAIERQEANGQQELVNSSQLPAHSNDRHERDAKAAYKKMGIKVYPFTDKIARIFKAQVKKIDNDPLFVPVILPAGWKLQATTHSMWNDLVDDKGRVRAAIFYKAAFYDRSAHINFIRRYSCQSEFVTDKIDDMRSQYTVKDNATGEQLFGTEIWTGTGGDPNYASKEATCKEWLNKNFPNHNDIGAYWD